MKADLHIHSCHSNDGELAVPEIVKKCIESGVDIMSITDHNSIAGSREAKGITAENKDIHFIPGIEIDCNYKGIDLHLLGYQIDLEGDSFDELGRTVRQKYMDAVPQLIANLERLGIHIDQEELMSKSGGEPPTGEQFAEVLLKKNDPQSNPQLLPYLPGGNRSDMPLINFYLDFFAQGKPAHVKIDHLDFRDAVALVKSKGGIPIVAHPGLNLKGRESLVNELIDQGAEGLEVFNNYHSNKQVAYFAGEIKERAALMTCGSDFHGHTKPRISLGQYTFLESYRKYLEMSLTTILKH